MLVLPDMSSLPSSWITIPPDSDFSLQNIPFGVASVQAKGTTSAATTTAPSTPFCCTAVGNTIVNLSILEEAGLLADIDGWVPNTFRGQTTLNRLLEQERLVWEGLRRRLQLLFFEDCPTLRDIASLRQACLYDLGDDSNNDSNTTSDAQYSVMMHLPVKITEYTDFYSSREHASNVGRMLRPNDAPLQPNWLHLPVGYHGRASTVVVSGTPVKRPCGQLQKHPTDPTQGSTHGPSQRLDFELEMAFYCGGPPNALGQPLSIAQAKERIFGFSILNDWSARDIQRWEYVPLGPFTSKNFCTSVSPWIITTMALEPYTTVTSAGPRQTDPTPLSYLEDPNYSSYDVQLTVDIQTPSSSSQGTTTTVCTSNFRHLYWNAAQQLVHHTVTGCIVRPGDLMASGTISGTKPDSFGSMLELSWNGQNPITIGGEKRTFLQDGDTVIMRGICQKEGFGRIGFGTCAGTIEPAPVELVPSPTASMTACPTPAPRFQDFKLYGYWRSSCTWRVRAVLYAMGIPYTTIPVNLLEHENTRYDYTAKNSMGQVPMLECLDTHQQKTHRFTQSVAIIEFLHEAFPNRTSLFPVDPVDRALARQVMEMINSGMQPLQNMQVMQRIKELTSGGGDDKSGGGAAAFGQAVMQRLTDTMDTGGSNSYNDNEDDKGRAFGKENIERGLVALEEVIKRHRQGDLPGATTTSTDAMGPFCIGTLAPTVADVFLVPQLYNARRFNVNVENLCPTLVTIETLCLHHPWFEASHPDCQPDVVAP